LPLRCVVDTNVLVSHALFEGSAPCSAVRRILTEGELLASAETLAELREVILRPKFDRYLSRQLRQEFLAELRPFITVLPAVAAVQVCRDPRDDVFLAVAAAGDADYLLTGDQDLLALHSFQRTVIITPADFLARVDKR
jgi:uncharacterized protein